MKRVRDYLSRKGPGLEMNEIAAIEDSQEIPQEPKTSVAADRVDRSQVVESPSASDVSELLASFEEMRAEEQRLTQLKQQLLARQNDLRNKLIREMEKKKAAIANLASEIPDLQNRTRQLGQVLDVDICK